GLKGRYRHSAVVVQAGLGALVGPVDDVQGQAAVGRVAVVAVLAKGAGADVQLDVAAAFLALDGDQGVAEVGPAAAAGPAGLDDPQTAAVDQAEGLRREALGRPDARQLRL